MQEEGSDTSFEFVDKKIPEMSSLSNVAPPSELPSFVIPPSSFTSSSSVSNQSEFHPTKFTPAIPVDIQPSPTSASIPKPLETSPSEDIVAETQADSAGSLFSWMKDTVSQQSQSILSKVAEKAKHSVDSVITTLDPQMREFIGGNKPEITVIVASDKEIKISPVREAIQALFPSSSVHGIGVHPRCASQPVGFEAASKAANSRVRTLREIHNIQGPVVIVENFIAEIMPQKWYDLGLVLLDDNLKECQLETYTQMVPVPTGIVQIAETETPSDYAHKSTGYSVTIGSLMAKNLETDHSEWQMALSGVSRRQMILTAAKVIANLYKTVTS